MTGEARLRIIPLGGVGTFGMNCTVLEADGSLLVVDAGVKLPQGNFPGVDLFIPDFSYVLENRDRLAGIVLTHGHDDHVGALPFLLRLVSAPVFGTGFTLALARERLNNASGAEPVPEADLRQVLYRQPWDIGPFSIEAVRTCHSVPECAALVIKVSGLTMVHSGDFRLGGGDARENATDLDRLREVGGGGVDVLLCDSTNADRPGTTPPESEVAMSLEKLMREASGRVFITTFASHIQRIGMVMEAARRTGRRVLLEGRRMVRNCALARELGHLSPPPGVTAGPEDMADPRLVFLTTGTQGEPTSALARITRGEHSAVEVRQGDTVVFSSRMIPGNELAVGQMIDDLFRMGARVFYQDPPRVHVSGHGSAQEIGGLLEAVRPRVFVPVHGDYRQLMAAADLARGAGIPEDRVFVLELGQALSVEPDGARIDGSVPAGRMMVDGDTVGDMSGPILRDRRRLAREGVVIVVASLPRRGESPAITAQVHSVGVAPAETSAELDREAGRSASEVLERYSAGPGSLESLREELRSRVRAVYRRALGKRPMVVPVVIEE